MIPDLRQARLINGVSLEQLSGMLGVSKKSLARYEKNPYKAPADVAVRLFAFYKIPLSQLKRHDKPL